MYFLNFDAERVNNQVNRLVDFLPRLPPKGGKMAIIQEKVRENKIVSCKFKACLGRDENGKQIFKYYTWYPLVGLTKAV